MSDNKQATKTYTLLSGTHLSKGKRYYKGDVVELTDEQAARFEPGRLQVGGKASSSQSTSKETTNTTTDSNNVDVTTLLDQPPIKAITDINALTSVETLNAAKTAEEAGQKRAGVVKAITSRIDDLSKADAGGGAK